MEYGVGMQKGDNGGVYPGIELGSERGQLSTDDTIADKIIIKRTLRFVIAADQAGIPFGRQHPGD
jgi:hypothetical protein